MPKSWDKQCRSGLFNIIGPAHDKTYNKTCTTSKDSDQPAHLRHSFYTNSATSEDSYPPLMPPRSLIRVFADRMCLLQTPSYPERDRREHLPYLVDLQADMNHCWSHRSHFRFCLALAQFVTNCLGRFKRKGIFYDMQNKAVQIGCCLFL